MPLAGFLKFQMHIDLTMIGESYSRLSQFLCATGNVIDPGVPIQK